MTFEDVAGQGARTGEIAVYRDRGGRVRLEVRLEGDTVWLSLAQIATLFGRDKSVISRHLRSISIPGSFAEEQLLRKMQQLPPTGRPIRSSTTT